MTARFSTQRGGKVGFWLSKPGKNVLTARDPEDMLLTSEARNLSFLARGIVSMSSGNAIEVLYGGTLRNVPAIMAQIRSGGYNLVPSHQYNSAGSPLNGLLPPLYQMRAWRDRVTFLNVEGASFSFNYLILMMKA